MEFENEVLNNNIICFTLHGDLIGENNGPALIESANEAINKGILNCCIDIEDVRFINSSGLGVLITMLTKFRNHEGEVVLVKPSNQVSKLLAMTKLDNIFKILESKEDSLSYFQNN